MPFQPLATAAVRKRVHRTLRVDQDTSRTFVQ